MMKINQQSSINFNGRIGNFKTRKFAHKLDLIREDASLVLNRHLADVQSLTRGANEKRINFFNELVNKYSARNIFDNGDADWVDKLYNCIKSPTNFHMEIVRHLKTSFQNLEQIFNKTGNDKDSLKFVKAISLFLENNKQPADTDLVLNLLNSNNKDFYISNFSKIKSYINLNLKNPDLVKELDSLINEGKFNSDFFDKKLAISNIVDNISTKEVGNFSVKNLLNNYSEPRKKFLESLQRSFYQSPTELSSQVGDEIKNMYDSTNKKNVKVRTKIMEYFYSPYTSYKKFNQDVKFFNELNILFKTLDSDKKYLKSFIYKLTKKDNQYFENPKEINDLLSKVSSKKLDIFYKNFEKIMYYVPKNSRMVAITKGIEKPYIGLNRFKKNNEDAIKYKFVKTPSALKIMYANFENMFNILRFNLVSDKENLLKGQNLKDFKESKINVLENELVNNEKIKEVEGIKFEDKNVVNEIEDINKQSEIIEKQDSKLAQFSRIIDRKLKKEMLANDILGFAKQKLGVKTFENQREAFIENATKMRYEMLPEIFASIMDTRKADRAVGKYRINSSNKDALRLYTMVNGNNKKFVNYLLKKRNVDGSRMFEVKEIITTLENAEKQIQKQKQNNSEYRAKDVRKYYNHLLEAKIQQYGKVTRNRASKTK